MNREETLARLCNLYGTAHRLLTGRDPACLCGHVANVAAFDEDVLAFMEASVNDALDAHLDCVAFDPLSPAQRERLEDHLKDPTGKVFVLLNQSDK